jgi:hypothetical protein
MNLYDLKVLRVLKQIDLLYKKPDRFLKPVGFEYY